MKSYSQRKGCPVFICGKYVKNDGISCVNNDVCVKNDGVQNWPEFNFFHSSRGQFFESKRLCLV